MDISREVQAMPTGELNPEKQSSRCRNYVSRRSRKTKRKNNLMERLVGTKQRVGKENKFQKGRERASVWSRGYQKPASKIVDQ